MTISKSHLLIADHITSTRAALDTEDRAARAELELAFRASLLIGMTGPALVIAETIAAEANVDATGYPSVHLSSDAKKLAVAAANSGLLPRLKDRAIAIGEVRLYNDASGVESYSADNERAVAAHNAAEEYRRLNS